MLSSLFRPSADAPAPAPGVLTRPQVGRVDPAVPGSPPRVTATVHLDLPADPARDGRIAALSGDDLVETLAAGCRSLPAVRRHAELTAELVRIAWRQASAAERVAAAEAAGALVGSAAAPGLGAQLADLAGQLDAARGEQEAAGREAAAVRDLIPAAWVEAAEAVRAHVGDAPHRHAAAVEARLRAAAEGLTYPPSLTALEEYVLASEAAERLLVRRAFLLGEVRQALLGDPPAGVERHGDVYRLTPARAA